MPTTDYKYTYIQHIMVDYARYIYRTPRWTKPGTYTAHYVGLHQVNIQHTMVNYFAGINTVHHGGPYKVHLYCTCTVVKVGRYSEIYPVV